MLTIETLLIIVFVTASSLFPYQTNYHCYMDIILCSVIKTKFRHWNGFLSYVANDGKFMHICNLAQYAGGERCSFGLIFILFPMKIAGGHHHGSQGKSPPLPPRQWPIVTAMKF